ncbi:hypothetical protein ACP275_06G078200 [Erythranthe tilingii]
MAICCSGEKPVTKNRKSRSDKKTLKEIKRLQRRKELLNRIPEPVNYGTVVSYDRNTAGRRGPGRTLTDNADLAIYFYNKSNNSDYNLVNVLKATSTLSDIPIWGITFIAKRPCQTADEAITFQTEISEDIFTEKSTVDFVYVLDDAPAASPLTA